MWFDEVALEAADPRAVRDFAVLACGLEAEGGPDVAARAGRTRLVFRSAQAGAAPRYHIAFAVPPAAFEEARRRLAAHAALLRDGADEVIVHDGWDTLSCYVRDPAGNMLEHIARRSEAPESGQGAGVRSVCEVGLVVDDVPETVARLGGALGLGPFRPGDEQFAALGTESGLLIVVRRGREWYPHTGLAASPAPLAVALTLADGTRRRVEGPPYRVV